MNDIKTLLAFFLLCLAGLTGISSWPIREASVGYFKIGKNPYGVAIYQDGPHANVQFENTKSFTARNNTITISPTSTITYSRDDIIFDEISIYTQPTQEQIDYLKKNKVSTTSLPKTFYLVNPNIPGMLTIQSDIELSIDRDNKIIIAQSKTPIVVTVRDTITL